MIRSISTNTAQLGTVPSRNGRMPRAVAIAACLACSVLGSARAFAAEPPSEASRFAFLDAPPPLLKELPPEPTREGDEYPRRLWEGFPSAGVGTPFCRGTALGVGHCGDAAAGPTAGAGLLYRVSPYVAVGLDASFARFTSHASTGGVAAYSHASWIGVLVRGYFLEHGPLDPYIETGFGQGAASAGYVVAGTEVRTESAAPSVMAGAGIDFWVAPWLRVGPALSYRISWISDVRGCYASTCTTYDVAEHGVVGSYATFSVRGTVALGREM